MPCARRPGWKMWHFQSVWGVASAKKVVFPHVDNSFNEFICWKVTCQNRQLSKKRISSLQTLLTSPETDTGPYIRRKHKRSWNLIGGTRKVGHQEEEAKDIKEQCKFGRRVRLFQRVCKSFSVYKPLCGKTRTHNYPRGRSQTVCSSDSKAKGGKDLKSPVAAK